MRSISSNVSFKTCASLLVFCFDDLSIGLSGVLMSPPIYTIKINCKWKRTVGKANKGMSVEKI